MPKIPSGTVTANAFALVSCMKRLNIHAVFDIMPNNRIRGIVAAQSVCC